MRKLFSYFVLALCLMVSTQVKAADDVMLSLNGGAEQQVATMWDALQQITASESKIGVIRLTHDINFAPGQGAIGNNDRMQLNDGEKITLNMNGHNVNASARLNFVHASFMVTGKGVYNASISQAFNCYGSNSTDVEYGWSSLTIDKDVTVKDAFTAIGVLYYGFRTGGTKTQTSDYECNGVLIDIYGVIEAAEPIAVNGNVYNIDLNKDGVNDFSAESLSSKKQPIINIHSSATLIGSNDLETIYAGNKDKAKEVRDYYNQFDGKSEEEILGICPHFHMDAYNANTRYYKSTSACIYAAGYVDWNIEGTLMGGCGIYVKSGNVNIEDATIIATADEYWEPIYYGNGFIAAGSAIIFDNNSGYGNVMTLHVTGDTKVSAATGFAVQECITKGQEKMSGEDLSIESGTFIGNENYGSVIMTEDLGESAKEEVSITGGTFGVGEKADELISQYINEEVGVVTEIDVNGNPYYIITKVEEGDTKLTELSTACDNQSMVFMQNDTKQVIGDGEGELNANITVKYLSIGAGCSVEVADGYTLTAGAIILDGEGELIINPEAKVIINGLDGIVSMSAEDLTIRANANGRMGMLLMNPNMRSNKNPKATVEYFASAKQTGAEAFTWDRIASVFLSVEGYHTANKSEIDVYGGGKATESWNTDFEQWSITEGWKPCTYVGSTPKLAAFAGYALTNISTSGNAKYEFSGALQGASTGELIVKNGWNYFGNSFTAPMDIKGILEQLAEAGVTSVNLWDAANQTFKDVNALEIVNGEDTEHTTIPAMHTFFFLSPSSQDIHITLNYSDLVWDKNK